MKELEEWLKTNKIEYTVVDKEVIEIGEFGKMFFQDMNKLKSIFRQDKDGNTVFNSAEDPEILIDEGINYTIFRFGDNWYYTDLRKDFKMNILKYIGQREKPMIDTEIVNLGVHTAYELLNGSFLPAMWVKKAKYLGHKAIGICDRNTMAACYNLQKECDTAGITPVFGYSFTFNDGENKVGAKVYVQTDRGLRNLLRIQKAIMVDSEDQLLSYDELLKRGEGNVLVLDKYSSHWIKSNNELVQELRESFQDVFFQVDLSEYKAERIDIKVLESAKLYFDEIFDNEDYKVNPVLLCDSYYLDKDDSKNKIILNKIADGAAHEQSDDQYFKDVDEHYKVFEQLFDENVWDVRVIFDICADNAMYIANNAKARFCNTRNFMPKYCMTPEEEAKYGTTHNMFNQLLEEGLEKLVPADKREEYRKQMEYEKYIIESTNNVDYLLVQYDTCNYARRNNILVGCGRGSAAGSLLLYLLGITLIDPMKFGLIFERFLLPERAGLYPSQVTVIGEDIESCDYVEIELENGQTINIDKDAQLYIRRGDEELEIYADELQEDDDILWDNRDELFTLKEL